MTQGCHILAGLLVLLGSSLMAICEEPPADANEPEPIRLEDLMQQTSPATPEPSEPAEDTSPRETKPVGRLSDSASAPAREQARKYSEADIARRVLEEPRVPVTYVKDYAGGDGEITKLLPPEGTMVVDAPARIRPDTGAKPWMIVEFLQGQAAEWTEPLRLQPCRLLEAVEKILKENPQTLFQVSGETTLFDGRAYLLLHRVTIIEQGPRGGKTAPRQSLTDQISSTPENETPSEQGGTADGDAQTANTAADTPGEAKTDVSTTDLISSMLQDRPGRPVQVSDAPEATARENQESVAPAGETPLRDFKRGMLVDRLVRIVPEDDGQWWEARFESDNTLREPPMRVLPGEMLARAQQMMRVLGLSDLKLYVTGNITHYRGQRYLLIRKLIRKRNMGEF